MRIHIEQQHGSRARTHSGCALAPKAVDRLQQPPCTSPRATILGTPTAEALQSSSTVFRARRRHSSKSPLRPNRGLSVSATDYLFRPTDPALRISAYPRLSRDAMAWAWLAPRCNILEEKSHFSQAI
jgi:hypothetical protein